MLGGRLLGDELERIAGRLASHDWEVLVGVWEKFPQVRKRVRPTRRTKRARRSRGLWRGWMGAIWADRLPRAVGYGNGLKMHLTEDLASPVNLGWASGK